MPSPACQDVKNQTSLRIKLHVPWTIRYVKKCTTLTPVSCKFSSPILQTYKNVFLHIFTEVCKQMFQVLLRKLIDYAVQYLTKAAARIIVSVSVGTSILRTVSYEQYLTIVHNILQHIYFDEFAQSIDRQWLSKHNLKHEPRNSRSVFYVVHTMQQ
jgi:hypothetical protein